VIGSKAALVDSISRNTIRLFSGKSSSNAKEILRKAKYLSQQEIDDLAEAIRKKRNRDTMYYVIGFSVFMLGGCWAAIPIYRLFCEDTGYGTAMGRLRRDQDKIDGMDAVKDRLVRIRFNADAGGTLYWKFKPLQEMIYIHPGETALAFFTATNSTEKPVVGVSTYNIIPYEAAAYFNKIQCFCFDEQLLNPGEQVDLPVFFYLDPDFAFDPLLGRVEEIILSYTFFESKSNVMLKRPTTETPETPTPSTQISGNLTGIGKQLVGTPA